MSAFPVELSCRHTYPPSPRSHERPRRPDSPNLAPARRGPPPRRGPLHLPLRWAWSEAAQPVGATDPGGQVVAHEGVALDATPAVVAGGDVVELRHVLVRQLGGVR